MTTFHASWIEVDLDQFRRNLDAIRKRVGGRMICLPVKANGYGHGLVQMGLAADQFGVDRLAVFSPAEAAALRKGGVRCPILVCGAIHEEQIEWLITEGIEFTISSKFKADLVDAHCRSKGLRAKVHLEVDTGMRRTGMRPETALAVYREMRDNNSFCIVGIYSHFASSDAPKDPFALLQIAQMVALRQEIQEPLIWHMANSGGVCFYPESYFDMVRPGLLSYGIRPDGKEDEEIKPFFSLKAKLSYFKVVPADEGISYDHLYRTKSQTRIVTVPIGYGDGYARALTNVGPVLIRGKRYQVAGRICMDQFMVDIGQDEAYVGDVATMIGAEGNESISLLALAKLVNTDPRDILCRFNDRIARRYFLMGQEFFPKI